jgi:hypothetical protein
MDWTPLGVRSPIVDASANGFPADIETMSPSLFDPSAASFLPPAPIQDFAATNLSSKHKITTRMKTLPSPTQSSTNDAVSCVKLSVIAPRRDATSLNADASTDAMQTSQPPTHWLKKSPNYDAVSKLSVSYIASTNAYDDAGYSARSDEDFYANIVHPIVSFSTPHSSKAQSSLTRTMPSKRRNDSVATKKSCHQPVEKK